MASVLVARDSYKPFAHPWAFDAFRQQNQIHWLPEEVPLHNDVRDWLSKLTKDEKQLLTGLFRFFVQGDIDIAKGYYEKYIPMFPAPELRMMLGAFAAMEGIHVHAYSLLMETVGMAESEYVEFLKYEEMAAKHEYIHQDRDILTDLAVYSAFGEGLQLYSTFAILLSFPRRGLMSGMGQIVTWSIRDESLHVESMTKLFRELVKEKGWDDEIKAKIYQACRDMVELEDSFIDLCFADMDIAGITKAEVKQYVRYLADYRLNQLGLKKNYNVENPLGWLEETLALGEHANFFEQRATEYSKGAIQGSWGDLWESVDKK